MIEDFLNIVCAVFEISDSCKNVLVEDCYISVGDDAIAIKSGWDKYGVEYNRPSVNVTIRNVIAHSQIRYLEFTKAFEHLH